MNHSRSTVQAPPDRIADGVWRVGGGSWNGAVTALSAEPDANVFHLRLDGAAVLVDCGTTAGRARIEKNLRRLGEDAAAVTDLVLTHSHWDHTEAAADWQAAASGLTTHAHAVAAGFLGRGDHRLVGYQMYEPPHRFRPFRVDHSVLDRETFHVGGSQIEAHHMPGHTADSTLYLLEAGGLTIGIAGDLLFSPRSGPRAVLGHLSRLWLSNLDEYVDSLLRLSQLPIDILLPGHGRAVVGRRRVEAAAKLTLELAASLAGDPRVRENLGV
jgi:glyoxylase-like metal-dependent hydrolase (beta-lactamase superfamily II)